LNKIKLTRQEVILWNDIIYAFRKVRRGRGFDPLDTSSGLARNVQRLYYKLPFLFTVGDKGDIYPSEFGFELGTELHAYLKTNRLPNTLKISKYQIFIE
jgi:hypothetical protein